MTTLSKLKNEIDNLALLSPSKHLASTRWGVPSRNKKGYNLRYNFSEYIFFALDGIEEKIKRGDFDDKSPDFPDSDFSKFEGLDHDSPEYKKALYFVSQRNYKLAMYIAIEGLVDENTPLLEAKEINRLNLYRMNLINQLPDCFEVEKEKQPPYNKILDFTDLQGSIVRYYRELTEKVEYLDSQIDAINSERSILVSKLNESGYALQKGPIIHIQYVPSPLY